LIILEFGSDQN
jgi:hypothetical protein